MRRKGSLVDAVARLYALAQTFVAIHGEEILSGDFHIFHELLWRDSMRAQAKKFDGLSVVRLLDCFLGQIQ